MPDRPYDDEEMGSRIPWLIEQVGGYFTEADADSEERRQAGQAALDAAEGAYEQFVGSDIEPGHTRAVELRIVERDGTVRGGLFAVTPSPVVLMMVCLENCDDGDEIHLIQKTAAGVNFDVRATWPFDLDVAERMTRPAAGRLREQAAGSDSSGDGDGLSELADAGAIPRELADAVADGDEADTEDQLLTIVRRTTDEGSDTTAVHLRLPAGRSVTVAGGRPSGSWRLWPAVSAALGAAGWWWSHHRRR